MYAYMYLYKGISTDSDCLSFATMFKYQINNTITEMSVKKAT